MIDLLREPEVQGALIGSGMAAFCWGCSVVGKFAKSHLELWMAAKHNVKKASSGNNGNGGNGHKKFSICEFHGDLVNNVNKLLEESGSTKIDMAAIRTDVSWIKKRLEDDDINFRELYTRIGSIRPQ